MNVKLLDFTTLCSQMKVLRDKETVRKKINYLQGLNEVQEKLSILPADWIESVKGESLYSLLCFLLISEEELLTSKRFDEEAKPLFLEFVKELQNVEAFYHEIGGILGYTLEVLKLVHPQDDYRFRNVTYRHPEGVDLTQSLAEDKMQGLRCLPLLAEMYPVGGAGDRLDLRDPETHEPLPVASLPFLGKSLLELLFDDLFGREYLFYKLFGRQLFTPVAMMTSPEKENTKKITKLLEDNKFFGRRKEMVRTFAQPLAPLMTKGGSFVVLEDWTLKQKPGGHGVLWKRASEEKIFDWFFQLGREKGLIRQINNPVCGLDHALVSFFGLGVTEDKKFGFLSCPRRVAAQEGMDVLFEETTSHGLVTGIVNIEYTDFVKRGIEDVPAVEGGQMSCFPSNTNILFCDFKQIQLAAHTNPYPGLVYNPKTKVEMFGQEMKAGRLESAMQNIADDFLDLVEQPVSKETFPYLSTFIAFNDRKKTISVTKKAYHKEQPLLDTPQGAFYELMLNREELLSLCGVEHPFYPDIEEYDPCQAPFFFDYHPALGPFYDVIQQKIKGGKLVEGAELALNLAEFYWEECTVVGSLQVTARQIMGPKKKDEICFSHQTGGCYLKQVVVKNKGIDTTKENGFWKKEIYRKESLEIVLEGHSLFVAENVVFEGGQKLVVPDGVKMTARTKEGQVVFEEEKLPPEATFSTYKLNKEQTISCIFNKDHQ